MTTPTPSQGFLPTSNAGFANLSSDGFANLSSDGFLPEVSSPSLLESKQQQVTAISDAKKQALDPSVIPYENLSVTDGDTLRNRLNGEKYRLTDTSPGTSFDTFETPHGTYKTDAARMLKDKQAIALDIGLPTSYIPDLAVFNRGRAGEEALKRTLQEAGNVQISPTGKVDRDRLISELIDPTTGQSLLPAMNTPELNAGYHSKYNIVREGEDLIREAARREDATKYSVSDANRETLLGGAVNLVATVGTAFGDSVGRVLKAPALIAQRLRETGITQKQRDLFTALNTKMAEAEKAGVDYAPTAEEQTILESPLQAFKRETLKPVMDGERNIAASDFLNLASVAQPPMSVFQKLSASDRVQQGYIDPLNVVRDTAARLVNTAGTDELRRQAKGLQNDAVIPSITEGYKKFKGGKEVDGALQIADAVVNYVVGTGRIAANNKQAAIEETGRIVTDMLMAGVSRSALFVGLGTETEAEAVKGYVKEHGVHPEGLALIRLLLDAWASAALDSVADIAVFSKPGVVRAIGTEGGTEIVQSVLEQDAAKQDLSKIDLGEALSAGSLGAIGGAGISVASHPEAAIIEAAQGVGTIAKGAISGAKKVGPYTQWAAQAVGDVAKEYGNVMPDGMVDATKAGLAKLTGAVTGMPTDSLGSGLKAAGSLAAHATKEGAKAVGGAVGDYLDSAFPVTSQAVKDFKVSNLVPDKISNAVDAAKQAVTDAAGEVNSSTSTSTADPLQQSAQTQDSVEALKTLLRPENIISATSTPEDHKAFVAEASRHNAELAKEMFAITDPATAPTEENTARAKVLLTEFRKNKDVIDGIKAGNSVADTTDADIVTATTRPTDPATDPAIALQAVDRTIRSMRQPDKVSLEQAEAFQAKATLTPEQTAVVSAFIATKKASATMTEVNKDVIFGKPGFLGMVEHQAILSDALDQENIPAAQSALDSFKAFAASQVNKVDSLNAIVSAISTSNVEQVKELVTKFAKDFPTAQPLKLGKHEILKLLNKSNGLELAKASTTYAANLSKFQGLANNVGKEANMLTTAVAEAELHFKLGTTIEAKAVPVKQESGLLTPVGSGFPNAPSEYKIDNIDEMIANGGGVPAVSQFTDKGYQSVKFKDFHLSIDNENKSAEVAKVELGTEERGKGHGINAYKALGDALAERGITLTSSEAQYADGKNMWHKLVKQGHAVKKGSYFEYVPTKPTIESKPAPVVEVVTDTTEVVYDLAKIKDLALKKNYSGRTNLINAVNVIFSDNSLGAYTAAEIAKIGKALEGMENKSLGDYLLDSARKFIGGKQLSDYYSAKVLDKVSKYSALITTPNFFSTLKDAGVKDALGLTPEQLNGLDKLTGFVNKFAETFKKDTFTDARLAFDITTLLKNPALYFMKETGRDPFDENFVSTLATVGYSWVANNANDLIQHSNEGINSLLGRDSKHRISADERKLLSDKQILKSALIHSLGSEIVSSLGMTFNTKEDGSIESKMVEALGAYAVMTLEHMGVLAKSEVIHKKVFEAMKRGEAVSDTDLKLKAEGDSIIYFTGVATVVTPVKGKSYSNTELSTETKPIVVKGEVVTPQTYDVQGIVDDNRMSKGLLSELFDYKQQLALPLLVAPTLKDVPKRIKRGIKRIPERVRKALHKYNSNAFTVNMGNHTVLDFLEREQQLRIFKYNENLEGVHDVDIKSVQGTNRTTKNELEAYYHLVDHLKLQPKGMFSAMYFMSTVVSNGRANMEGLINPQASKFFRHMIGMASWESTIDSPEKRKLFKIAVAEALGSKVDRQGDETSLEAFDRLIKKPEIADGIATIKYLKSGIEMSAEEKLDAQEAILAAIEAGRGEMHTLEALTALATYHETEPFTTRMTKEVDGITNGVIIGLIQLMGQRPEEMLKFLEAGGVSQDSNFVYGDFISKVGSFDNYQRVASTLVEYMDAFRNEMATLTEDARLSSEYTKKFTTKGGNTSTLDGIDFFIGNLGDADNLTSEARDLAKNPVLITNYGAAFKKIIQSLGEGTIENFYKKLTEARHNQEALNEIAKQLNKILKRKPEDAHKFLEDSTLPHFDKPLNEALKFTLSNKEIATIHLHVANSIGAAMQHALETHFGTFITKRKELNNAMTLVHAAFIIKYDAAYKAARDLKGSNLSREERDALVKTLEPSMASFDHAMSDGEMDTELFVAPNESKVATDASGALDEDYRVQVTSNTVLPHGTKSTTARGQVSYYGFPGVRSVILAIHSSDGAVQYKLMETSAVLNVHDADVSGIDGTMAMTQRQNLAFKEVMEDYSMRASIQKTLLRAMKALTPAEVKQVEALLQITNDKAEGFLGHDFVKTEYVGNEKFTEPKYESIDQFVSEFTDTTKRDLVAKKALLASLKSWGQYNLNHGAYVTEEESEAFFAAIDELRDSLERDDAESNTAIQAELTNMVNAERNRINDQIKSSATEDIDIANFVADFKPITVSASTVNSIFDELGKIDKVTDFPSHTEHLRTVLNESIRQVLNPMELLVRKLGKANSGVLAKGKIYLSMGSTGRLHTTDQSAQEVYAHELVHAVTEAALSSNYWLRKQARSLYEKVQDQITPESFLDYDGQGSANDGKGNIIVPAGSTLDQTIAKAKAVHDHIFDNNDITEVSYKNPITNEIVPLQYSNGLLEFVAMGTTNAKFIKILAGINTNKSKRDVLTYADRVYNLFVGAINSVTSLINKTKDPAANVALMILMHKLANANQVKSNIIMRKFEENGHLEDIVNSKLYKALAYSALKSGEILKARKNKTLSAVGEMIGLSQDTSFEAYKKVAGKLARKHGITHENILSKLVTEAEGITAISAAYLHKLSKSNMLIDQRRRLHAQSVTNQILGSFIAGTPSKSEGIAITKVMLKTDMGSLIDSGYTWDKMFGLLKSRSKRLAEIATVEKLLQAAAPTNFDYYKTQAATLGYMMVNGQPLKWGTKINAVNIAHLGGTGKKVEGDLKVIEGYLDILASLHAIKYSDAGHVTDFVTVAEREFAKDKDNNGVMLSYLVHKDLKARALEQSFEGQKEQMFKGYIKEIYNPRVSIKVAPDNAYLDLEVDKLGNVISTEAKMKAKGYIKVRGAMSKDPTDLNKEPMSLYVNKDGDTATFNKMGVSLTSDRRKGHDQAAGYSSMGVINPALIGSWDTTLATKEGQKILARADYADLSKIDNNNLLVPVENAQHEIVGYRYLMNEATKDDLLEKENDFAKVLGAMEGSIVDKQNSKQINNEYVNLMHDDFVANYDKDPDLFIKFSPHSQNAKHRELYAMLPNDMRREIKRVWKSDVMYVRANMFDAIFGYRKFTVTEGSKEEDEMNAMHEGVLTKFRIALRDKLRTPTAKKGEIALQEIAKEVKDAIVIKLGGTLYNNVISNNLLLWAKGVGRSAIIKDQAMFLDAARQYHKDVAKLMELERSVRINPKLQNSANVKAKINSLKDHMAHNPIAFLMDSGVSQTIIEDVDTDESQYTYKGMIEEKLAPLVSRVPKPLKTLASIAYMNHNTPLYKFMREATQLSDLVARATLHKHNTEKKGMSAVDSINDIKDTFIDYDAPTSKQIQYLNDTNFLMFTKFFIRSQKIIYQTYANAPARALSLLGFEEAFGEMPTINDSNIINTSILGKINFPLGLAGELAVPHGLLLLDPTGAGGGSYTPE